LWGTLRVPGNLTQGIEWLPRTNASAVKKTTYIHPTRCYDGNTGKNVYTANTAYKYCLHEGAGLRVVNTFQLPPALCKQTCDQNDACEAYTVDEPGENCWILSGGPDSNYDTYWKIGTP
jgi:hypothetical protein